ncbi:MAG: restriction endonuclease subunit S [Candidatus Pacebacteria bacterium]|nr:restriction endonuclease subunit S [Candidatus Paceibacterota bacterium]
MQSFTSKNLAKLDRSTWEVVRFGDVVKEVRETSQDHIADGIDHVVGLEHLSPLDIHIRSWGNIANSTTFSRRFRKGQVLFGRRRAYQRKAAIANFDGICSGDIIVMEAIEDKLDPNLLSFLVHSEGFYNWAVSTSAGSLSPRTKFKSLAEYEFRLPPRDVQKKLAELLWVVDEVRESLVLSMKRITKYKKISIKNLYSCGIGHVKFKDTEIGIIPEEWNVVKLSEVADVSTGNSAPQSPDYFKNGAYPFCRTSDVGRVHISENLTDIADYLNEQGIKGLNLFKKGTILIPKSGASTFLNHRVVLGIDSYVSSHLATVLADDKKIITKYLFNIVCFIDARNLTNNPDYPSLRTENIKEIKVALPKINEQKAIVEIIDKIDNSLEAIKNNIKSIENLRNVIINSIF